ncbi:hypothetical protein [Streptomyces sp. PTD5-9]|uniref:hypothetical protein n=1 Tax=Streptomyces sp. PTD5-9 TaxID=3120150 RepID=UPI0030085853
MSSNDQQYPHGLTPGQSHGYGPGYEEPPSGPGPRPEQPYAYGDGTGAPGAQPHAPAPQPPAPQPYGGGPSYGNQQQHGHETHGDQQRGDQRYGTGNQPYGSHPYGNQSYGNQSYGNESYAGEPYAPQPYGGPHGAGAYAPQGHAPQGHAPQAHAPQPEAHRPHAPQPHAHAPQPHASQAYGDQRYGSDPHATHARPGGTPGAGAEAGAVWPTGAGQESAAAAAAHDAQDLGVAQTWEGQTWDTQYQPTIRRAEPTGPGTPAEEPVPAAAETAYLPRHPQPHAPGATGSRPLPPEAPTAPASAPVGAGPVPTAGPADGAPAAAAPASGLDTSGYGTPTTLGNSRVTDAQRARAEGRSPIIPPGIQPAGLTAALGLLLALGAAIGSYALLVPLVLLQAVTAAGWFRLNGMWPARQGIALAFAGGVVADVALLAAGRQNGPAAILGTLGVWVLLTLVLQLRSQADPDERMYGLMATVASAALSVLAAGHLAAVPDAVTAGAVAVAAAVVVRALPLPGPASVVAALLAGAGAGAAAGALTGVGGTHAALLGLAAGGCALIGLRAASYDYPSRFVHMTAGVALPLAAAAPAVWLVGRVLI